MTQHSPSRPAGIRRSNAALLRAAALTLALAALSGCVRIPVNEDTLFQPKDSVTLRTFEHETAGLEEVFFESDDGTMINAWYLSRPDARATVLFFGGYGFYLVQSKPYLDMFLEQEVNVLLVDYRGYGRSEGEPSVAALKADGLRAYETLRTRFDAAGAEIIVHGHSLGTFMATYVAEQRDSAGLVLENPATSARDWTKEAVPWYLRMLLSFDIAESFEAESNLERIKNVGASVLILAGGEDMLTPPAMARELHDAAAAAADRDLVVIEEGSHPDLHEFDAYRGAYRRLVDRVAARSARLGLEAPDRAVELGDARAEGLDLFGDTADGLHTSLRAGGDLGDPLEDL